LQRLASPTNSDKSEQPVMESMLPSAKENAQ
jgi:hypothetical protein